MASPRVPPCQTGRMTLSSLVSRLTSPRSAYSGHGFLIKAGLTTTTPYAAPASPLSMERERLSPTENENSPYQTVTPKLGRAIAKGRTHPYPRKHAR